MILLLSLPVDLQTVMKCLHASLTHNASPTPNATLDLKQWEALSTHLGQPLPFQTEHQAEMSQRLIKLCRAVDVVRQAGGDVFGRRDVAEACVQLAASSPGSFMRRMLLDAMMKVIVLQCEDEGRSYPMVTILAFIACGEMRIRPVMWPIIKYTLTIHNNIYVLMQNVILYYVNNYVHIIIFFILISWCIALDIWSNNFWFIIIFV